MFGRKERPPAETPDEPVIPGAGLPIVVWGVIGTGWMAWEWLIDAINAEGDSRVAVLASHDSGRAATLAARLRVPRSTGDIAALLADPEITAIAIATDSARHGDLALAALAAGKHVLCEPPLALTLAGAEAAVAAAQRAGTVLGMDFFLRNHPAVRAVRHALLGGMIGTPVAIRLINATPLPLIRQGWRIRDPEAGGILLDRSMIAADMLRFVLGEDPVAAMAMVQSGTMAAAGIEDAAMSLLSFPSGLIAQIFDSYTLRNAGMALEIHGTLASVIARDLMSPHQPGEVILRGTEGDQRVGLDLDGPCVRTIRLFNAATRGAGPPTATGQDGVAALATALALKRSAQTRKMEDIGTPPPTPPGPQAPASPGSTRPP